jgi:hypothetical protein
MQPAQDATPPPPDAPEPSDSAPPPSTRGGRLFLIAGAMGFIAAGAFIAGLILRDWLGSRAPALGIMAALLLGLKVGVDHIARRAAPSLGVLATSLGAAGLAPIFVMGALWAMSDPLVASSWRCGTGDMTLLMSAPIGLFLTAALGTTLAAGVLGGGRGEAFRPLIRGTAITVAAGAGALVLLSAVRAARSPDVDRYIDSLSVVATLEPLAGAHLSPRAQSEGPGGERVPVGAQIVGDIAVYRYCWSDSCGIAVGDAPDVQQDLPSSALHHFGSSPDATISIRRDAAHHFVVLSGPGRVAFGEPPHFGFLIEGSRLPGRHLWSAIDVGVRDVADSASPPLGWLIGGAAGLLAACAVWGAGALRSRRVRAFLAGAPGVLENGWIHFEDGRQAARVDPGAGIAVGPVLVLRDAAAPRGAYRASDLLGASHVLSGTRQQWTELNAVTMSHIHAQIIAICSLSAAPLFAAMTAGLVI